MAIKTLGTCSECGNAVSAIGSYVKVGVKYSHEACARKKWTEEGKSLGRRLILEELADARLREETARMLVLRQKFDALPRCGRCGTRMGENGVARYPHEWGEARLASSTAGVCLQCMRAEVAARNAAKGTAQPSAPKLTPVAASPSAPAADRFSLIEIDEKEAVEREAEAARKERERAELQAREAAKAAGGCVRCGKPVVGGEIKRHCRACWNSEAGTTNAKADAAKAGVSLAKFQAGIRNLEID